ncbi:MAG: BamA/TamA family outer membrane protein, partial [Campylobacterales bacterium]|nr:BamA/TamA family outer membrane protein [Campylobacterales bacterium]
VIRNLAVIITLLLSSLLFAANDVKKDSEIAIFLKGNKAVSDKLILDALGVKKREFYEFYKSDTPKIAASKVSKVHSILKGLYRSQGFFGSSIRVLPSEHNVSITIGENNPIKVTKITIKNDFDLGKIKLFQKGERFNPTKFSKLKNDIQKRLLKKGYCAYHYDNKAYVDLPKRSAILEYTIEKNKICRFGEVRVHGLESIQKPIVTSRINIAQGEKFNTQDISDIYDTLQKLEAFDSIVVDYSDKNDSIVPIDITLKEKEKTFKYKYGVGYDTNLGLRASASIEKFNFLSNAKKLSLWLELSPQLYSIESKLLMPSIYTFGYYFDYQILLGYKVEKYYDNFDTNLLYGAFELNKQIGSLNYYVGIGYEYTDYTSKSGEAATLDENNLFLIYPYIKIIYDKRDSKLNPKNGYYLSSVFEYGLPYNDQTRSYSKIVVEGRYIKSIEDLTLSSVLKIGSINELHNETPQTKKFFAGGSFSNRAYGYNEIGVITSGKSDTALGGVTIANISLEANYPLYKEISGAIFSDISMISDKENTFDGETIKTLGAGLRYNTPIGPFKIDVGVNTEDSEQYGVIFQLGQSF